MKNSSKYTTFFPQKGPRLEVGGSLTPSIDGSILATVPCRIDATTPATPDMQPMLGGGYLVSSADMTNSANTVSPCLASESLSPSTGLTTMQIMPATTYASSPTQPRRATSLQTWSPKTAWVVMSLAVRRYLFNRFTATLQGVTARHASSGWRPTTVYDIADAGPNHCFAIQGSAGRLHLAHNCDFSSQEAFIAAVLSKDPALMKAYMSGDPYLAFAISAGAAPKDATKRSHGDIRNLFKSTVLGLQYGMGSKKLSVKLTADTGKPVSIDKAKELINLHRQVYHVFYSWKDRVWERYRSGKPVSLADGWYLDVHSDSKLSTLNMPVQGAGSAVMRQMIDILLGLGIKVICPVHDSVIYECREEDAEDTAKIVGEAMLEACFRVCGEHGMRVGQADVLRHSEFWETEKNAEALRSNRKYMEFAPELVKVEGYLDLFLK